MGFGPTTWDAETIPSCTQSLEKILGSAALLIVDNDQATTDFLKEVLNRRCALLEVTSCAEDAEALRLRIHFDLILVNTELTGVSGLDWVRQLRNHGVQTHVIYLSALAETQQALEALRNGADDYLVKPFSDGQVLDSIDRSLNRQTVVRENSLLRLQLQQSNSTHFVVGNSEAIKDTLDLAHRVAPTPSTVLLQGETGAGKELIAHTIHNSSQRSGNLVALNCGSIAPELFESELFGHSKGAFTGAMQTRDGLLVHANKGTVFLDEISELPMAMQTKLLRVLEERVIRPVGSEREIPVDLRIIAATNRDLNQLVELGEFREDLFYRLNVFYILIPPLRQRIHDIEPLVEHFMRQLCIGMRVAPLTLMHTDWQRLKNHHWPGNVRELRNVIERTLLLGRLPVDCLGAVSEQHSTVKDPSTSIESPTMDSAQGFPVEWCLADVERAHIERVLNSVNRNKSAAARILGVSRKTLERKERLWYPEISTH